MPLIRLPKQATLMALRKFYELAATGFGCIHALGDFEAVWFRTNQRSEPSATIAITRY